MDPRVKTPPLGLQQQFTLSKALYDDIGKAQKAMAEIRSSGVAGASELAGSAGGGRGGRGAAPAGPDTLASVSATLNALMATLQGSDVTPPSQVVAAVTERRAAMAKLLARWSALKATAPKP
jgi:hypothetical protein